MEPQEKEMRILSQEDLDLNPELVEQGLKVGDEVELLEPTDEDGNALNEDAAKRTALNYVYYENSPGELAAAINGVAITGGPVPLSSLPTLYPTLFMANTNTAGQPCVTTVAPTSTPPTVTMNSGLPSIRKGYGTGRPPVK